jgi:hypothetical protein
MKPNNLKPFFNVARSSAELSIQCTTSIIVAGTLVLNAPPQPDDPDHLDVADA